MFCRSSVLHKNRKSNSGFGLIELMVSISILVLVMSVVFVNQQSFNGSILLRGQAYEVALRIREVQLNAISARGSGDLTDVDNFRAPLGVQFKDSESTYTIFKDNNDDGFSGNSEIFDLQGALDERFYISEIRLGASSEYEVSVVFQRPNFDASFYTGPNVPIAASSLEIDIARRGESLPILPGSCADPVRTVEVTSTGQISVLGCTP